MRDILVLVGVSAVLGLAGLIRRGLVVVDVNGASMEPALFAGDRVLIRRVGRSWLRRGDVIVLESPPGSGRWGRPPLGVAALDGRFFLVKRVVALAGDVTPPGSVPGSWDRRVPSGTLVVAGDNRPSSRDSRQFGFIPRERVLGVVVWHLPSRRTAVPGARTGVTGAGPAR